MTTRQQRSMVRPTDLRRRSRFVQALAFSHSTSVSPTWRRVMTVSTYFLLFVLLTALAPAWIPITFVVGLFRRCSFVILRLLMFFWVYLATELVGLFRADVLELIERRPSVSSSILLGLTRVVSERLQAASLEIRRLQDQFGEQITPENVET